MRIVEEIFMERKKKYLQNKQKKHLKYFKAYLKQYFISQKWLGSRLIRWFPSVSLDKQLVSTLISLEALNIYYWSLEIIMLLLFINWFAVPGKKNIQKSYLGTEFLFCG